MSEYQSPPKTTKRYSIADALFTSTQQKVLSLLFGQPERSFYTSELIAMAGAGTGAVQRELARLSESGLVRVKKIGNQKHFQANAESPIFDEIRQIVDKTFGLSNPLTEALQVLRNAIHLAFVYGSVAKKLDTASSDVDLLIVSETLTLEDVYQALEPAEQKIGRKINLTLLTEKEFKQRRADFGSFVSRVLSGEILELIGSIHSE